jgi:hypothetical protein
MKGSRDVPIASLVFQRFDFFLIYFLKTAE